MSSGPEMHKPQEYFKSLYKHGINTEDHPPIGVFRHLHTMNIYHIFNKLACLDAKMRESQTAISEDDATQLRKLLHQYTKSIKDFKYVLSLDDLDHIDQDSLRTSMEIHFREFVLPPRETEGPNHPFDTEYRALHDMPAMEYDPIRHQFSKLVMSINPSLAWSRTEKELRRSAWNEKTPPLVYSSFVEGLSQFFVGLISGCCLVVPMIIMIFNPSTVKSVVVVSISLPSFALALALFVKASTNETVTATAAYAAVLVVFVGANGTG